MKYLMDNHVCVVKGSTSLIINVLNVLLEQHIIQSSEFASARVERDLIQQLINAYQSAPILKYLRTKSVNARTNLLEFKAFVGVVPCIASISQKNKNAIASLGSEELAKLVNVQQAKSLINR